MNASVHEPGPPGPLSVRRALRYLLPLALLGLAVHLILPQIASLKNSVETIRSMSLWWIALAAAAQGASYWGSGYLLATLARLFDSRLPILYGIRLTLAGNSFGMVAGGIVGSGAATYHWLQKEGLNREFAALAGSLPGLFNNLVLVVVSVAGLVHLLVAHELSPLQAYAFIALLAGLVAILSALVWMYRQRERTAQLVLGFSKWWSRLRRRDFAPGRVQAGLQDLFHAADVLVLGGWRGPLLGSVLNVVFDMLTLFFLFTAAGHPIPFGVLLLGYGIPLLLGKIAFVVPGGVGVVESAMTALYTGLGVPSASAVVVVLAYRVLSFWLPLLLGFPAILTFERVPGTAFIKR